MLISYNLPNVFETLYELENTILIFEQNLDFWWTVYRQVHTHANYILLLKSYANSLFNKTEIIPQAFCLT